MTINSTEKIKLLDGNYYDKAELLKKMVDDSFYYGECSQLMLSQSALGDILKSPKTYYYKKKYGEPESQALRDGWLFHTCILEPEKFEKQIFVDVQSKNTKAYKLAQAEHGKAFTIAEKENAERLADAFYRNQKAVSLISDSQFEVPAVGEVHGYPFRGKADILKNKGGIVDLKTTTKVKSFKYSADSWNYSVQTYIYCQLFNTSYKDFIFVALDKGSLDVGIFECSKEFYEEGKRRTLEAIKMYESFFIYGDSLDDYTIKGIL